jgi:hypothetical protein
VYGALFVVIVIAAAVRLWGLSNTPFVADEFLDVNATYGYHQTGQWQAWDFNHEEVSVRDNVASDERAWLYRIQVAWLYGFLEPTEGTVRLVSALWGIATTIILYFVTWRFTKNRWIALIVTFLWAVSVPSIEINRKVRMYSMFAPVFLLFSWSVFELIDGGKKYLHDQAHTFISTISRSIIQLQWWYIVPVGIFGMIAYHLHPLTANIIFVILVYFVLMVSFFRKDKSAQRYWIYIALILLGATVVRFALPSAWVQFMGSLVFFDDHWSYIGHILRNYWHPLIGIALISVGAWHLIKDQDDIRPGMWIISTFFTILFAAILLWNRNVGPQYIFFAQPFGLILAGAGIYFCADKARQYIGTKKSFFGALIIGAILVPFYGYFFIENNTYHITSNGETANYRKVFDYVKRNAGNDDVMIARNFRNYYWSGMKMQTFDFGSERSEEELVAEGKVKKITRAYVEEIIAQHPRGWVVLADNDEQFVEKEALAFFEENFIRIDDSPLVRGKVNVYKWGE